MGNEISTSQMQHDAADEKTQNNPGLVYASTVLENVESIKYIGVALTNDLIWNTHINNVWLGPQDMNEAAYKWLVRPVHEYGSSIWDSH